MIGRVNVEPDGRRQRRAGVNSLTRALVVAAFLVTGLAVAGCGGTAATPSPSPTPTDPLMTVVMSGGLCAPPSCDQTIFVERDGRVHQAAKPPNDLGTVPPAALAALVDAIRTTDFASIKAHPFTGQCPTAFDGQEIAFEFATPGGVQRVATCEVAVDWGAPLFVAVSTALGPFIPIPTT